MKRFLVAIQFLTIFPVKIKEFEERELGKSMSYFPVIGLFIGFCLVLVEIGGSKLFPQDVTSVLVLITLILLSGGIHLDGFSDTIDGFYGGREKEDILEIMRDPRIGFMGVVWVVCLLLLKFTLIRSLSTKILLVPMCTVSRWSMVTGATFSSCARINGKGRSFIEWVGKREWFLATLITLCVSVSLMKIKGVFLCLSIGIITFILTKFIKKRIGGLTGDTLGAISEIVEVLTLLFIVITSFCEIK
ncbi:MAG: adenosylcobinamide-GDP ribazoletransferase [bacterium]|nr:adenosylcobinamide-GDP ribazoletransferase [bacterium]